MKRRYFRGDAGYANPGIYEFLEAGGYKYTIRLPANGVLQKRIGWLLKRPVGPPPHDVRRYYASFSYQAAPWTRSRRVVAKVEWHPGELYPRVGFIVTNMTRPPERVTLFYNQRGTAEQHIKEGKNAITWTRLSCRRFAANAVRLQLHALAYNLGNFLRTLTLPEAVSHWSMTTLHSVAVHTMHYNFVRLHQTLRCTPAMAAGVSKTLWELSDMVKVIEDWEAPKEKTSI